MEEEEEEVGVGIVKGDDHKDDYLPKLEKIYLYKELVAACKEVAGN